MFEKSAWTRRIKGLRLKKKLRTNAQCVLVCLRWWWWWCACVVQWKDKGGLRVCLGAAKEAGRLTNNQQLIAAEGATQRAGCQARLKSTARVWRNEWAC